MSSEQVKPVTIRSIMRAFWVGYHEARRLGQAVDAWPARGLLNAIKEYGRAKGQDVAWPAHWTREEPKPRPMSEAPRDGTVILVFVPAVPYGIPCFFAAKSSNPTWRIAPSMDRMQNEMIGWLPCPTYTGEAVE